VTLELAENKQLLNHLTDSQVKRAPGSWVSLIVILSKRSLRGEEPVLSAAEGI
jgi:hypothetical protein